MSKEKEVKEKAVEEKGLSTDVLDDLFDSNPLEDDTTYTTELLKNIVELDPSLTADDMKELLKYLKGAGRPKFMDRMMTQTNEKLNETIKLMAITYLSKVPVLLDYQKTVQQKLLDNNAVDDMSLEDLSKVSYNIQREINELLTFALNVSKSLSNVNTVPTKVERLAQSLMYVSEATRDRIEEIVQSEESK